MMSGRDLRSEIQKIESEKVKEDMYQGEYLNCGP